MGLSAAEPPAQRCCIPFLGRRLLGYPRHIRTRDGGHRIDSRLVGTRTGMSTRASHDCRARLRPGDAGLRLCHSGIRPPGLGVRSVHVVLPALATATRARRLGSCTCGLPGRVRRGDRASGGAGVGHPWALSSGTMSARQSSSRRSGALCDRRRNSDPDLAGVQPARLWLPLRHGLLSSRHEAIRRCPQSPTIPSV